MCIDRKVSILKTIKIYVSGFSYWLLILFIVSGSSNTTHAAVKNVTGQLKLLATVDSRPAFSPVIWTISNNKVGTKKFAKTLTQHAVTIELEPDTYQITLSTGNNKSQTRNVTIVERKQYNLVIDLD